MLKKKPGTREVEEGSSNSRVKVRAQVNVKKRECVGGNQSLKKEDHKPTRQVLRGVRLPAK